MAELIQEVFWLTSADYQQLLYVSPAFETIWGRPLESLYTYPGGYLQLMVDSIYPSDRENFVAAFAPPLQYEYKGEYRIVRPDGSIRWMRSRCFPIRNSFGETWAIAGLSEDITESKRAEELLHQRQQEFTALVEHSPDIISRFDRQLRHIYVNPALELATGMSTQEFIGKTHRELGMPPELISLWEPSIERVFQTRQPDEHEFSYLTPQGWKYYQSRLFPEFAADGSVATVLAICRDLTQHKQTQEALRQSEQRFRTVFEFAPIGITLIDKQGKLFASNRAFQELIGYTKEELQNQPCIQFTHPGDCDTSLTLFQELLGGRRTGVFREKRYCRKDGSIVWGKVAVSAVFDPNGVFQYAIAMIQDIMAQKQAQLELENAYEQLEKRVTERTTELKQANALLQQEIAERSRVQETLQVQKDFLQAVLDTNPNVIFVKDQEGKFVLANLAFAELYGMQVEDLLGKTDAEIHPNQADVERFEREDRAACQTNQTIVVSETTFITPTNSARYINGIKKPLFLPNEESCLVLAVGTDITELKQAQEELKAQKEFLQAVLDTNPSLIFVKDSEGTIILANQAYADLWGTTVADLLGKKDADFHPNFADIEKYQSEDRAVSSHREQVFIPEEAHTTATGELRWFQTIKKPIFSSEGQVNQVLGVSTDITEHKRSQEELKAQKEFLQTVLNTNPNLIYVKDREGKYLLANLALADFYGIPIEEVLGHTHAELTPYPAEAEQLRAQDEDVLTTLQQKLILEQASHTPSGELRWYQILKKPLFSKEGQVAQLFGLCIDITAHKQAETQIKESLRDKEILLQEIHHRVKNNLQVISSLLDLQSQYIDDSAMLEVFRESYNRVRSMALIHEQLYQSKDCARINLSEYITLLTYDLFRSYGVKAGQITLDLEIEEISLNISTAIPCGLIINELVSNALKHAFPQERHGIIKVALHSDVNNQLTLKVTDNGIGFPEHSEFRATKSLGLQLVNVLANQLEGTLELVRRLGTEFKITFSELSP